MIQDENCRTVFQSLSFYNKKDQEEVLAIFLFNLGKNILHFSLERKFFKSSDYRLENHPGLVLFMVNQIDRPERTPLMVAKDAGGSILVEKLTKFMRDNKISFQFGIKQDKTEGDLLEAYNKFGYETMLKEVHNEIEPKTDDDLEKDKKTKLRLLKSAISEDQAKTKTMKIYYIFCQEEI